MNKQFSKATKKRLQQIKQLEKVHLDCGMRMLHAYKGAMYGLDLFAAGAIKRSMAHCSGFRKLILDRNFVCAASILRLQLDNALRFYAAYIVENPHKFAVAVLGGEHVRNLKDKEGKLMTDKYLVSCLSKEYPWITKVYQETSGYIHFSKKHIFYAISDVDGNTHSADIAISSKDSHLPEVAYREAIEGFIASTNIFLRYLEGWILTKDNPELVGKSKEGKSSSEG